MQARSQRTREFRPPHLGTFSTQATLSLPVASELGISTNWLYPPPDHVYGRFVSNFERHRVKNDLVRPHWGAKSALRRAPSSFIFRRR